MEISPTAPFLGSARWLAEELSQANLMIDLEFAVVSIQWADCSLLDTLAACEASEGKVARPQTQNTILTQQGKRPVHVLEINDEEIALTQSGFELYEQLQLKALKLLEDALKNDDQTQYSITISPTNPDVNGKA